MARIDAVAQVLSLYDVLYFLNPDTAKDTVANSFRKFIRAGKNLRRVHQLLKDEVGEHHLHTFPRIEEKDRPKPTWVVTSYDELHEFLGEYFARHPKTAERSYVFLDANREALQAIWGPEPEAWSAAKAVYPSIPLHVNQAFKHLGILPEQSSTPGIFTAVIPAALLPVLVAKVGLYTDSAFLPKSFNRVAEEEGNRRYFHFRCYRRDHVTKGKVGSPKVEKAGTAIPSGADTSETSTPCASSCATSPTPSTSPDPSEGKIPTTPSQSGDSAPPKPVRKTRKFTHTRSTGCLAYISARPVKGNTSVADDVKMESEKVHQANAAVAEDATTDHRKLPTKSEDADNAQGDMLEVTLDLRHVGHDPNDVYEVCNLPLLPEVRKQYSSLAQVIWPIFMITRMDCHITYSQVFTFF